MKVSHTMKAQEVILLKPKTFCVLGIISTILLLCILLFPRLFYSFSIFDKNAPILSPLFKFHKLYLPLLILEPFLFFGYWVVLKKIKTKESKKSLYNIQLLISVIFICLFVFELILFILFSIKSFEHFQRLQFLNGLPAE